MVGYCSSKLKYFLDFLGISSWFIFIFSGVSVLPLDGLSCVSLGILNGLLELGDLLPHSGVHAHLHGVEVEVHEGPEAGQHVQGLLEVVFEVGVEQRERDQPIRVFEVIDVFKVSAQRVWDLLVVVLNGRGVLYMSSSVLEFEQENSSKGLIIVIVEVNWVGHSHVFLSALEPIVLCWSEWHTYWSHRLALGRSEECHSDWSTKKVSFELSEFSGNFVGHSLSLLSNLLVLSSYLFFLFISHRVLDFRSSW
jgi:hypothetical protein